MRKTFCDHCNKEIFDAKDIKNIALLKYPLENRIDYEALMELCIECHEEFWQFLRTFQVQKTGGLYGVPEKSS